MGYGALGPQPLLCFGRDSGWQTAFTAFFGDVFCQLRAPLMLAAIGALIHIGVEVFSVYVFVKFIRPNAEPISFHSYSKSQTRTTNHWLISPGSPADFKNIDPSFG